MRKIKAKSMNLFKVGFLILSFVASYVYGDSLISKGRKYYFNSCQCGNAVFKGYFFTNYQNTTVEDGQKIKNFKLFLQHFCKEME